MGVFFTNSARSFKHGIHPKEYKEYTRDLPIERMPCPDELVLPVSQHLGGPSRPIVKPGDRVYRGQLIAEPSGFVSASLHASVTGWVKTILPHNHPSGQMVDAIVIRRDAFSPQSLYNERTYDWKNLSPKEIIETIRLGGFVGMGGAAFPTHVKLSVPPGKKASFLIVNAAECEPYLNADYRMMLEKTDALFLGIRICLKALGANRAYIGVETNKQPAIDLLTDRLPADLPCEIIPLKTKYPQGSEKMLTESVLHKEIPSGGLPIDIEVIVHNVGTLAGIGDMFRYGQPLIERVVTVAGPGIRNPANLMIPVGTKLSDVIEFCGGMTGQTKQILFGGPMMGAAQRFLDVPVTKGTSGILFLTDEEVFPREEYPCIRCIKCVDACPVFLNPTRLGALARARRYEDMLSFHIMDCIECGSCSYVCPSNIPLVQRFRVSKAMLREIMARERMASV